MPVRVVVCPPGRAAVHLLGRVVDSLQGQEVGYQLALAEGSLRVLGVGSRRDLAEECPPAPHRI